MVLEINKDNYEKEVVQSELPVIVDFWAEWCGPCKMMAPVFEKVSANYEGKLKFAKLDTQAEPELTQNFSIQGIPCLIIIKDGKEVDRIVGFNPESQLISAIDSVVEKL